MLGNAVCLGNLEKNGYIGSSQIWDKNRSNKKDSI